MLKLTLNARQSRMVLLVCGRFACCAVLAGLWLIPVSGQTKAEKKNPAGKKAAGSQGTAAPDELSLASDGTLPRDPALIDFDQTEGGRQKLNEVQSRGKEIFAEREEIDTERLPLVRPRDKLLEECAVLRQRIVATNDLIAREQKAVNGFKQLLAKGRDFVDQIRQGEANIFEARTQIAMDQDTLSDRQIKVEKINAQILPFDQKLVKLFIELGATRKKWLEVRQPLAKYALGDFDALKTSLDEWLAIDELWPDAFSWAALCAYELGDYEAAWSHVDKAEEVRQTLNFPKAWPKGEALRGLIAARLPERRGKSAGYLQSAALYSNSNKNPDWQVQFLIGRAGMESEKTATKAKAGFTRALKINPDAAAVKFWNARLQTTSVTPATRDVEQGTKTLEQLWEQSPKKSWRLAQALVLAYDAYDRETDAEPLWKQTLELAPKTEHENLLKAREVAREKRKSLTAAEGTTKSKSDKPSKKAAD